MNDPKTVLFVDDDPGFLQLTGELMAQASEGRWKPVLAENAARALAALNLHEFDLLVVDLRMPVMNGLQFVRVARSRLPNVPMVILTGYPDEQVREVFLREGVSVMLEKPTSAAGFETLFLALSELLAMEHSQGFRGLLQNVQLQDILQIECLRRNSSVLEVFSQSECGRIVLQSGNILHAEVGARHGEQALFHLLNLKHGEFRLQPFAEPKGRTVSRHWEMLLMEAAQMRDEAEVSRPLEPVPALEAALLPPVEWHETDQAWLQPLEHFHAVSMEGHVLAGSPSLNSAEANSLAGWLKESAAFRGITGLGALQSFEAGNQVEELACQFQGEALIVARRRREVARE